MTDLMSGVIFLVLAGYIALQAGLGILRKLNEKPLPFWAEWLGVFIGAALIGAGGMSLCLGLVAGVVQLTKVITP